MSIKNELIPKRRFKEFENADAWEQRKFGDIGTVVMCKRIFKEETSENGDVPFYKIGTFGGEPDAYITRELFEKYKSMYPYPQKGDILISASGSIGRTVEYTGKDEYFQDSNIVWLQHNKNINNSFLKVLYSVVQWSFEGSTIKRLYNDNFLKTKIVIPNIKEQSLIGEYFESLDNLITLHQRKLDKLKETKIAYISEMFPKEGNLKPERRFKGYKNEWESINLEQIATMNARIGWQNLRTSEFLKEGDYMLITGTDFENGKVDFSTCHFVSKERYEQDTNIQVQNGSILITKDGTLGKVAYVEDLEKPATLNAGVFNVRIKDQNKVDEVFLFQYLRAPFLMRYVNERATGGTIKHLNQNILVKFPILLPEKEEQIRIGKFLTKLDKMIESQQRVLSKLIDLKNAYLNEMFV